MNIGLILKALFCTLCSLCWFSSVVSLCFELLYIPFGFSSCTCCFLALSLRRSFGAQSRFVLFWCSSSEPHVLLVFSSSSIQAPSTAVLSTLNQYHLFPMPAITLTYTYCFHFIRVSFQLFLPLASYRTLMLV